jgi:hypothetical protein
MCANLTFIFPSPSAREHNDSIPRCENSQGREKTDVDTQKQAAVFALFSLRTQSARRPNLVLASSRYQRPFLQRRKAFRFRERIARIAEYESFQDVKRPPNREGSCKDHHQDKEHNLSFAEVTSGGPRGLCHLFAFSACSQLG